MLYPIFLFITLEPDPELPGQPKASDGYVKMTIFAGHMSSNFAYKYGIVTILPFILGKIASVLKSQILSYERA